MLNRGYKGSPDYNEISDFKVGISNTTPLAPDTDLDIAIPITDGTVNDDGSNLLTGADGGDNTTDNVATYKEGAGINDNTAQNLIANNTDTSKRWFIADLSALGSLITGTEPFGLWFYIKDATAFAKFLISGTAVEVKLGSDNANYYSQVWTVAQLATGWNWLTSNTTAVIALTETGTVAGNIDYFEIEVTTNNATDTFVAGDVVYDLLRQWATTDLLKVILTNFPDIDESNFQAETRCLINAAEANGFDLNALGIFNDDTSIRLHGEDVHTAESKGSTDEFLYIIKDRIED